MDEKLDELEESHDEMEPWLLSYADLFTLLVCFFVVIIAASVPDKARMAQLADALNKAVDGAAPTGEKLPENAIVVLDQSEVLHGLREAVRRAELGGLVDVQMTPRGVEVNASSELLFESGQAEVSTRAAVLMNAVATIAAPLPCVISVEGHTDDVPMRSSVFPSNWELSTARASGVVRRLTAAGIAPRRLTAVGFADTRPAARAGERDLSLEAARARNRRVVLLITRDESAVPAAH